MVGPYQARVYQSDTPARLSDLARESGRIQADGILRRADAQSRLVSGLADIANQGVNAYVQYQSDAPNRRFREAQTKRMEAENVALREKAVGDERVRVAQQSALQSAAGDPAKAIDHLYAEGDAQAASALDRAYSADLQKRAAAEKARMELASARLKRGREIVGGVLSAKTPEASAASYVSSRKEIGDMFGPEVAARLPESFDRSFLEGLSTGGMEASEIVEMQAKVRAAQVDLDVKHESLAKARHENVTKALASALPRVKSQEMWSQLLADARASGATNADIAQFGEEYSPDAAQRAALVGKAGGDRDGMGELRGHLLTVEREKGRSLTSQEQLRERARWASAGQDRPTANGGYTEAQYRRLADAEQWKLKELRAIGEGVSSNSISPMRAAELRREVQASYEQQVRGLAQRPAAQWVGALSDLGRVVAPRADAPRAGGVEVDIPGLGRQWFRSSADAQAALAEIAAGRARR